MSPAGLILNSEWFCGILSKNFETLLSVEIRKFIYGLLIFRKYFLFTILSKNYIRNSKFCVDFPFNFFDNNLNGKQNRLSENYQPVIIIKNYWFWPKMSTFYLQFLQISFLWFDIFLVFWTEFNRTGISFRPGPNPNKEMEKRYLLALLLQPF